MSEAAPGGDKPSWWDSLPEAVKNYVRRFIDGDAPQGTVEVGTPNITRQKPARRTSRRSPLVSKVQALLLQAGLPVGSRSGRPDGLFGPTTAKSWNVLLDRAQISSESAPRINPKRPKAPSPATMQYVTRFGKEILSRARPAAKPAKPAAKPVPKPTAKPTPKPPQVWDKERAPAEMPSGLTPRQQELWRRSRGKVEESYGGA